MRRFILLLVVNMVFLTTAPYLPSAQGIEGSEETNDNEGSSFVEEVIEEIEGNVEQGDFVTDSDHEEVESEDKEDTYFDQVEVNDENSLSVEMSEEDQDPSEIESNDIDSSETQESIKKHNEIEPVQQTINNEENISRLGYIKMEQTTIYSNLEDSKSSFLAGKEYTNKIYYIKKQVEMNKELYYLLSPEANIALGTIGWIKASELVTQPHIGLDRSKKTYKIIGTGKSYNHAWGRTKNIIVDNLSVHKNKNFAVNLTEKVGNDIWYRGTVNGQTMWIQSTHLTATNEQPVTFLGHLRNANIPIYAVPGDMKTARSAETANTQVVHYSKRKAVVDGQTYYLLSPEANINLGTTGWVKAQDFDRQAHRGIDRKAKTYRIVGTGKSYNHAWGGIKNIVIDNLSNYKDQSFIVDLTERVGDDIWHRGTVNGKQMWIQSTNVTTEKELVVSFLGHLRNQNILIYDVPGVEATARPAGSKNTNVVHYAKRKMSINGQTYYLLSPEANINLGTIGWVKAQDFDRQAHRGIDRNAKTYKIVGTGTGYNHAWGGTNNKVVANLSIHKNKNFAVNLTEKVGNDIWYRGTVSGQTMWIQSTHLTATNEQPVTFLGHLRNANIPIYAMPGDMKTARSAETANTQVVHYSKRKAVVDGQTYYLLSPEANINLGTTGWVKAQDFDRQAHRGIDRNAKTYKIVGTGTGYNHAWGGTDNRVVANLSVHKNKNFAVNLTEKVGNDIWYRGTVNGQTMWIQSTHLTATNEQPVTFLGHLRNANIPIYAVPGDMKTARSAGTANTQVVHYSKRKAVVDDQTYYLLSPEANINLGTTGWVKAQDFDRQAHRGIDRKAKTYRIVGTGKSYNHAWGGIKNIVTNDLSLYRNQEFYVNLTEKVGNNIWYRGTLNNKTMWIHSNDLTEKGNQYTDYNITFNDILSKQMTTNPPPQTDLYRNQPGYVSKADVTITKGGAITGDGVNFRSQANTSSKILANVPRGTAVKILGTVTGQSVSGSTVWYVIEYNKQVMYVHSSLASPSAITATTNKSTKVYASASDRDHVYLTLKANTRLTLISEGNNYHKINISTWRNAKKNDVSFYMNPNNNDIYQHLILSKTAGLSAIELSPYLSGKGILSGRGQAFIDAGKNHSVNEIYLMFHALLETGNGTSTLAKGVYVDKNGNLIKDGNGKPILEASKLPAGAIKVYNMFGIGAYDSNPTVGGAKYAYQKGWTTPEKAIAGGAQWISSNYINHATYKQDTLYKMKWNPTVPATHQYATDIGWAVKQAASLKALYNKYPNAITNFDIPRYK